MDKVILAFEILMKLMPEIVDLIKSAIESGKEDVEELRKKPLSYFVTQGGAAADAQTELEKNLPD